MTALAERLGPLPLIAILRGLTPEQAPAVGAALVDAGFRAIEVPLNSPEPFDSIRVLGTAYGERALIGAGTVLQASDVGRIADAGAELIVMPHADPAVIHEAKARGLACVPGVATPSEAFAALGQGADALKLFPAEALPPLVVRAWRAVLPQDCWLIPVGGITPEKLAGYLDAGANAFGLGSALFKPEMSVDAVSANARAFVGAYQALERET